MKRLFSFKLSVQLSMILFALIALFHAGIIVGILFFDFVPLDFLWGGRMETKEELLIFEIISLVVAVFCILVVLIKSGKLHAPPLKKVSGAVLWILFGLFLLNTVGNVLAKTNFEKSFAIVTMALAFLCLRLALERENIK